MAVLLQAPYNQFLDDDGNPLTEGFVYAYAAGTDTPKDTYTDYTGSTPAENPVELDAAGRADIWIEGDYKFTVKDANGATIRTVDHIEAIDQGGDMTKAVYDPANIAQQLVGTTAVQTVTNKTIITPNIVGTTTNNDAAAGSVGELLSATLVSGSATSLTTVTDKTIISVSLTAGDWDVQGAITFVTAASTVTTVVAGGVSIVNNTRPSSPSPAEFYYQFPNVTNGVWVGNCAPVRMSLAGTTTVYLVGRSTFTTSTTTAYGTITARRVR